MLNKSHKALVLLGPGAPEVQELLDVGFSIDQVIGVDRKRDLARAAVLKYPNLSAYNGDAKAFLLLTRDEFSYIHLDYCGYIDQSRVLDIKLAAKKLVSGGRLRVTFLMQDGNKRNTPSTYSLQFSRSYQVVDKIKDVIRPYFEEPEVYNYQSDGRNKSRMLTFWFDRK